MRAVMINQHVAYYLGSKIIAAVLNLGTMALFVRLGGTETYGAYVLALAWASIVYSFTLQALRFSFFACYREEDGPQLIATYIALQVIGVTVLIAATLALVGLQAISGQMATGIIALTTGLAVYDALHEMGRTRLQARTVAAGVLLRAVLMLTLGGLAIEFQGTATALAVAVAAAHLLAAIPLALNLRGMLTTGWSKQSAVTLLGYASGLVPAYGLDGIGLQLDRLLLSRSGTLGEVGSYGAVADLIRQVMVVVSEAISGAYMAIARSELVAGRELEAVKYLGQAFLAFTALTVFGAAAILRFDRLLLDTMFGAAIGEAMEPTLMAIVASSVAMVFRGYYFGQVLYLTKATGLLLWSNAAHCLVMLVMGLVLAPSLGITGVALALTLAHVCGCLVYIIAWRGTFVLRLPFAKAGVIMAIGTLAFVATGFVEENVPSRWLGVAVNILIFAASGIVAARQYNLLSFNDLVAEIGRLVRLKLQRSSS